MRYGLYFLFGLHGYRPFNKVMGVFLFSDFGGKRRARISTHPGALAFPPLLILLTLVATGFAAPDPNAGYYLRLRNEEFVQMMVPKEKFLLDMVRSIHEEMQERNLSGIQLLDLGIDQVVSPRETISSLYAREVERIVQVSSELYKLERKARLKADMQVLEGVSNLRAQIRNILGEKPFPADSFRSGDMKQTAHPNSSEATNASVGSDLFDEWKYNQMLDYKTKETLYRYVRARLIHSVSIEQEKRMFQRDLKIALQNYSAGDYALAKLELQDLLEQYGRSRVMDDVLFYLAECSYAMNVFDEALASYRQLLEKYPGSSLKAKTLSKIIYIDYVYQETNRLFADYESLLSCRNQLDSESSGAISYLVGLVHFKSRAYAAALSCLVNVTPDASTYYPALYLSAVCQSNVGRDDDALVLYHRIADQENKTGKDPVLTQIKNNALLKLGLIYYERGENRRAISLFNRVSQDFQFYDLSLMGKAWSAYRSGKPAEALENAERVVNHNVFSSYAYEAKVLAARSKELLGQKDAAINDLKQVFLAGSSVQVLEEESRRMQQIEESEQTTIQNRDLQLFDEAGRIRRFLGMSNNLPRISLSQKEDPLFVKAGKLSEQLRLLDSLETEAKGGDRLQQLNTIRQLRGEMLLALQGPVHQSGDSVRIEDPLIRRMGLSNYLKYLFGTLLQETLREKDETRKSIQGAIALADEARQQNQTRLNVLMEIKQEELEDYLRKLNQNEIWIRENLPQEFRVDLDSWASFSEYGISNINFLMIKEIDSRIAEISRSISTIDAAHREKRTELEKRIQGLLNDVAQIEKQMRQEQDKNRQQEKEQFFKNDYFERQKTEPAAGELKEKPENEKAQNP